MKTKLFLTLLLAIASVEAKADEVRCILPWGADEPWQMKYVLDTNQPNDDWTTANYDDSEWETLTGPLSNLLGSAVDGVAQYTWDERDIRFNMRRTFTLNEVNPEGYTFAAIHDNDIKVYINGQLVWEDDHIGGICTSHLDASFFQEGENQLAIFFWGGTGQDYLDYALFSGDYYDAVYYNGIIVDGIHYKINDDGETVEVVGIDEGPTMANILEQITFNGKDYPVTRLYSLGSSTLKHVYIPKTITDIQTYYPPLWWDHVETIVIDPENPVFDSRESCNAIIDTENNSTVIFLPCSTLPSSVKKIGRNSIIGNYSTLTIPEGVEHIDYCGFGYGENTTIGTLYIPASCTEIEEGAFGSCHVSNVIIDADNPKYYIDDIFFINKTTGTLITILLTERKSITIPEEVVRFGQFSFWDCGDDDYDYYYNCEYPAEIIESWFCLGVNGGKCIGTLHVPEGTLPRYLYQGWQNYQDGFKAITDGTYTYYGHPEGDTWFAPHIETANFPADKVGEEVTLSVVLNADKPVTAFQFDLYLPDGMEMTYDEDDIENILLSTARTTERRHEITSQQIAANVWRVICYSKNNSTFEGNEGEVCTITVKPSADMANGSCPVIFKNITTTYKLEGEELAQVERDQITSYISFFTPEYPEMGDANNDGKVNVTDIATVVSYIMENNPAKFVFELADVYSDRVINVTDITAIVNIILNGSAPQQAPRRNARRNARMRADEETTTASLEVIPFAIAPGEEKEVEVVLNNPDDAFTGLQFDLALPEGISLVSDEDGYFVSLGSRTTSRKHTIEAQQRADGTIRVMAYSNRNSNFSGTEGDVVVLTLKADDNLAGGVYDLQLKDIVLSKANGNEINQIEPADYEGSILSGTLAENPVIKGDITAEAANVISAAVTKDVTHIDLTLAAKVADDAVFTTANPNTLILASAETQNTSKNVVAGDICANLVLSDASAFAAPKAFTASQVSFSTNVNEYKTLTLPFNADVPEGFSASNATSVTGTTVNLESTSTINANSPVLIEGEGTLELKATNAVVNATGDAALINGMLSGTFKSIPAPVGSYVLQKQNGTAGFYLVADVQPTVNAFRAHLNVPNSDVKLYTFGDEATGISLTPALLEEGTIYYNVSGQRMSRMQKGINIVNGKKILY